MIFYLGHIVEDAISKKHRLIGNKTRKWAYGYNAEIDVVIISRDGTLGEIYDIMGLKIGLPEKPKTSDIINNKVAKASQKYNRHKLPEGLNELTMNDSKYTDFIDEEFRRRYEGLWIFIKGYPVYMTGTYYYGIQWIREEVEHPSFRIIQNELMIFWEACKADDRSYGMQYVKNRRMGASFLAIIELLEAGTISEDKLLGIVSKVGKDSSKIFRRLIKGFKRLPCFFRPPWDGTNTPKKELVLDMPTKRLKKGESITESDGLGTSISWHNTEINAMDGDAIFRSLLDESGKYPPDVPFSEYWYIVKTSHTKGIRITGKSMVVSTVNAMKKGGAQYKKIWDDSDIEKRDDNGETKSGLYRIFIPAKYCLEGMFDQYGFSIVEDPAKPIKTDEGKMVSSGSVTFLANKLNGLKADPEKANEFMRQFPETERDAFRDESNDCEFNLVKIQDQIDHNEFELNDAYNNDGEFLGNDDLVRGNFRWKNGIQDTEVIWVPDDVKGRFFIKKGCFPPEEFRNCWEEKYKNGILAKSPIAAHIGSAGVDPYNRTKTVDKRGSFGSYALSTRNGHTCDELPNGKMIIEYIARPKKVELFFEDIIMVSVFYSMPFLSEMSNDRFLAYVNDRGYRHFSLNNPFKKESELSTAEKEFGGAPQQDSKIRDAQAIAIESNVEDNMGYAMETNNREQGEMGDFPFSRTLYQLKDFDSDKRTKFDAFISYSLSLLANQKRPKKQEQQVSPTIIPFRRYDNNGLISKAY
jgi:hypothetical protein